MKNISRKLHFFRTAILALLLIVIVGPTTAHAAYFVDNAASGCSNGSASYNPNTRSCSGGNDTVYLSLNAANESVPAGSSGKNTVINIREGTYKEQVYLARDYITWQKYAYDSSKPLVDGEWVRPSQYSGFFHGVRRTGVTIDGLRFTRAGFNRDGRTMYAGAEAIRFDYPNYITIQNNSFEYIGESGVMLLYEGGNNLVQDNYMFETNMSITNGEVWSGAINFAYGIYNSIARRNIMVGCFGEGLQSMYNRYYGISHDNIYEYNTIVDNSRIAVYVSGSRNETVRYNLIYHTHSNPRYPGGVFGALGIVLGGEDPTNPNVSGHKVYGNMVVGTSVGLTIDRYPGVDFKLSNTKIFNNTFIEAVRNSNDWGLQPACMEFWSGEPGNPIGSGVEIKNNICWQTQGNPVNIGSASGIYFGNNLWNKAPAEGARSSSDPTYPNYPTLNIADYFQKTSGWTNLKIGAVSGQEFALRQTALHAIDKGASLELHPVV